MKTDTIDRGTASRRPRIAVLGVGAIGAAIGAALDEAAEVFLCRLRPGAPMAVRVAGELREIRATTWSTPDSASTVDWVVLSTKAQDIESAADWLDRVVGPDTRIVVAQNGVNRAERLAQWVRPERVLPLAVFVAAQRTGPSAVEVTQSTGLVAPDTVAAAEFAVLLDNTIALLPVPDFDVVSWEKLILNAALNSITALADAPAGIIKQLLAEALCRSAITEGVAVVAAHVIPLVATADSIMAHLLQLPADAVPSMLADRRAGRETERAFLTGTLVTAGHAAGVPTPTLEALDAILSTAATSTPTILEAS